MKREVFEKCLSDLAQIDYCNTLSLYNNNEPFIDKRLVDFIRQTSATLPGAKLFLFTNGDLLDSIVLENCFDAGLQLLHISVYEESKVDKMRRFQKRFGESKIKLLMKFHSTTIKMFHNYGGAVLDSTVNQTVPECGCMLPFRKVIVNAQGTVGLCCVDFFNEVKFENVVDRSLVDIFRDNSNLNKIRNVLCSGRKGLTVCERCSYDGNDYDVFREASRGIKRRLFHLFRLLWDQISHKRY
jgi:MoaA/NifB/PqqE/SkfB family radical SAM enzyme